MESMDDAHIALVSMKLGVEAFSSYRCDRSISLGLNIESLLKVLRTANNNDVLTMRAEDDGDLLTLVFEDSSNPDRISEYNLKLLNIDQEHMSIPEQEYTATVTLPSSEYQRIIRDLTQLGDSITIDAAKDGVRFTAEGDIGSGSVSLKANTNVGEDEKSIDIAVEEPVALGFNSKYLTQTCKAAPLAPRVSLNMCKRIPIFISYKLQAGHFSFFLAPQISEGDEEDDEDED